VTLGEGELARIALTVRCRDTDRLPKVVGAGDVDDGVQTMHNGVKVEEGGYYGEWMTEVIRRLRGHHEPQEEVAFHTILERLAATAGSAPTMLELGSFGLAEHDLMGAASRHWPRNSPSSSSLLQARWDF